MGDLIGSCYKDVSGAVVIDRVQFQAEVDKLLASHSLHGSESLCKLLKFLAKQALEHPGVPVKEYQIATEVFGRQSDFDPQVDSMVRVQAGRLRNKLAEYYTAEGASDSLVVELPKGSYVVAFHNRTNLLGANGSATEAANAAEKRENSRRKQFVVPFLSVALLVSLASIGWLLALRKDQNTVSADPAATVPAPYRIFWKGFVTVPEEPWVIFSNAAFVGRPDTGMRYYDAAKDGKSPILDHYTGVGEVLAVHNLDLVFGALHQSLRVKRGSLFSLDDAKNNDLIFIGSPSENLTLLEIPSTTEFVFRRVSDGIRAGNMEIVNVHPGKGEPARYIATPGNVPLTEDFAIVALVRGINPQHSELILAGTTTIGTQAAVEYVTRESYLHDLLQRLKVGKASELKPFEAVLQVKVARGVPVESSVVALRILEK